MSTNNIKEIAKIKGYTIKRLSEESGISYNTLYARIKRNSKVPMHDLMNIYNVLGIDIPLVQDFKKIIKELEEENKELKITIKNLIKFNKVGD